jgi:1,4-dihydroxy-2-naphthoate octaprenyltransferase
VRASVWLAATRPKTLAAAIVPVVVASAAAGSAGRVDLAVSAAALAGAVLIQVLTNFLNEIEDLRRGADTPERLGPTRAVAAGLISVKAMSVAVAVLYSLILALGAYLIAHGGVVILVIGALSLLFSWAYTGGPYPLAYHGLADVFVLLFFGLAAVNGTYFLLTGVFSWPVAVTSLAPGLLSMNILGVNNIRDVETDRACGKLTLAVRLGRPAAVRLYAGANFAAFATVPVAAALAGRWFLLIPLLALPVSLAVLRDLETKTDPALNGVLAKTGLVLALYGVLTTVSFLLPF